MTAATPAFGGVGTLAAFVHPVYKPGSIKQQAPGTGDDVGHTDMRMIAVRTNLPEVIGVPGMSPTEQDWFVMCTYRGGHYAGYDEVEGWPDIWIAP